MQQRNLIIGPVQRKEIHALIKYAEQNIYSIEEVRKMKEGTMIVPGNVPQRVFETPEGYRVVYSVEEHPGGRARHLSMSVYGEKGSLPSIEAVAVIMRLLGFKTNILDKKVTTGFMIKLEDATEYVRDCINMFEIIKD